MFVVSQCYKVFIFNFEGGAFGDEGVHLYAQGVPAHPQNPQFSTPGCDGLV